VNPRCTVLIDWTVLLKTAQTDLACEARGLGKILRKYSFDVETRDMANRPATHQKPAIIARLIQASPYRADGKAHAAIIEAAKNFKSYILMTSLHSTQALAASQSSLNLALIIRPSTPHDLPAVLSIYAHYVLHHTCTFETEVPSLADLQQRRADVLSKGLPWLVAARGDQILGYAYCNWFKPRAAYRYSAENSIYLAHDAVGQGLGRALLAELCCQAEQVGVRQMLAVIGDSANAASIALHRCAGFEEAGIFKACGWKMQRWLDTVLMQKTLGSGDQSAPACGA
jgi:L-amino acid N-acyltransferase YncA